MTEYDEEKVHGFYRQEGIELGRKQGLEQATLSDIEKLKRTLGLDTEAAMDALEIPEQERARYLEKLG